MILSCPKSQTAHDSVVEEFVLSDAAMIRIMSVVREVSKYDVNVLIHGESGTGKELLAKIIHLQSPRALKPFVPVNCGVLSGLMFEDKLFGHERGAFTGAVDQRQGCFEAAHRGTLFLDEVSELAMENQVDFLRVLEDFQFTRIGGSDIITVDVRVIAATNKDLRKEVESGRFREDLFYRLQVVPIHIPPLRERKGSIEKMVDHFLSRFEAIHQKPKPAIHSEVMDLFHRYDWPGNIRELRNLLERIYIISTTDSICVDHLPADFLVHFRTSDSPMDLAEVRKTAETRAIMTVLSRTGGDRDKAAGMLNISPRTLRHKLQTYNIRVGPNGRSDAVP